MLIRHPLKQAFVAQLVKFNFYQILRPDSGKFPGLPISNRPFMPQKI
jgi:hypothetical protein